MVAELLKQGAISVPPALGRTGYNQVLSINGEGVGLAFHWHEETWLALLHGIKQWSFLPPHCYDEDKEELKPFKEEDIMTCVQRPGEIVYFPAYWLHAT